MNHLLFEEYRRILEAGGDSAGSLELVETDYDQFLEYLQSKGIKSKKIANLEVNFENVKRLTNTGEKERSEMPVVTQKQIKKLQKILADGYITGDKERSISRTIRKFRADMLKPTQQQIYVDKSIDKIEKFGLDGIFQKLKKARFIASSDEFLVDGHHKWLNAMLLDPGMMLNVMFVDLPLETLLKSLENFGESAGNKKNE